MRTKGLDTLYARKKIKWGNDYGTSNSWHSLCITYGHRVLKSTVINDSPSITMSKVFFFFFFPPSLFSFIHLNSFFSCRSQKLLLESSIRIQSTLVIARKNQRSSSLLSPSLWTLQVPFLEMDNAIGLTMRDLQSALVGLLSWLTCMQTEQPVHLKLGPCALAWNE